MARKTVACMTMYVAVQLDAEAGEELGPELIAQLTAAAEEAARRTVETAKAIEGLPAVIYCNFSPSIVMPRDEFDEQVQAAKAKQEATLASMPPVGGVH